MRIIRLPEVVHKTGIPRSSIYKMMSEDRFPHNIKLGPRMAGWIESEIEEWLEEKVMFSRNR